MLRQVAVVVCALLIGAFLGWVVRDGGKDPGLETANHRAGAESKAGAWLRSSSPSGGGSERLVASPGGQISERTIIGPESEADEAAVKRVLRSLVEQETRLGARIKGVCDALALMNPDNANVFRDAFEESWKAGFDYEWERDLFLARYGEVMGANAVERYLGTRNQSRVLEGWSRVSPGEAVAWVNELPEGEGKSKAIGSVMWGAGLGDGDYALQVFEVFEPDEQLAKINHLMQVNRRRGGAEACAAVAEELSRREGDHAARLARSALHYTFAVYENGPPEQLDRWLRTLAAEQLATFRPEQLPEDLRVAEPRAGVE